jgi:hypothetical protein
MTEGAALKIPQLKDSYESWRGWRMHMQALLLADDLWDIVGTGSEIRPLPIVRGADNAEEVASRNTEIKTFDDKVKKATKILVTGISGELFYLWDGFPSNPRQLWVDLSNHFHTQTHSHRVSIRTQLDALTLKDRDDPEIWVKERLKLYQQLALSGPVVAETEQCVETLNALPSSWKDFRNMMNFTMGDTLTMVVLMQKVSDWHRMNFKSKDSSKPSGQAYFAKGGPQANWRVRGGARRDPKWSAGRTPSEHDDTEVRCFACKKLGHKAKNCPKKQHKEFAATAKDDDLNASFVAGEATFTECVNVVCEREDVNFVLADSGATCHMSPCISAFSNDYQQFESPRYIKLGDGYKLEAKGIGSLILFVKTNDHACRIALRNCLYVPNLRCTLLSIPQVASRGYTVVFDKTRMQIVNPSGEVVAMGELCGKLYKIKCDVKTSVCKAEHDTVLCSRHVTESSDTNCCVAENCYTAVTADVWHQRMAHVNHGALARIMSNNCVRDMNVSGPKTSLSFCDACAEGKSHVLPFPAQAESRAKHPLDLLHIDLMGPMEVNSVGGRRYAIVVVDDYSRYAWVRFVAKKSDTFLVFKNLLNELETQLSRCLKTLRSDCGGEFLSKEFITFLEKRGIRHELSVPEAKPQNGVAERMNRTLMERARTMLRASSLPKSFSAEALHLPVLVM